jgi:RNA polymerase sigma factor (sigma-70 family)
MFTDVFEAHRTQWIADLGFHLGIRHEDAEDIIQEAFLTLWTEPALGVKNPKAFLWNMIYKDALDFITLRVIRRAHEKKACRLRPEAQPHKDFEQVDDRDEVSVCLATIDSDDAILMRSLAAGRTYRELSGDVNMSKSTLQDRVKNARQQIRESFATAV